MPGMRAITVFLPISDIEDLDELVKRKIYPHRAEAIRLAVKDLIQTHREKQDERSAD